MEKVPSPRENKPVDRLNKPGKSCNMKPVQQTHTTKTKTQQNQKTIFMWE